MLLLFAWKDVHRTQREERWYRNSCVFHLPLVPELDGGENRVSRNTQKSLFTGKSGPSESCPGRTRPGGILTKCLNHRNWFIRVWRSRGSTPRELLFISLFPRESPVILGRKLISTTWIRDHVLWPQPKVCNCYVPRAHY